MWEARGHQNFNPSAISEVKIAKFGGGQMVRPPQTNREKFSGTSVLRMRYRGPIETYKMNKSKADIYKDLTILNSKVAAERTRLLQFITETTNGSNDSIIVKQENVTLFDGKEGISIEELNQTLTSLLQLKEIDA